MDKHHDEAISKRSSQDRYADEHNNVPTPIEADYSATRLSTYADR